MAEASYKTIFASLLKAAQCVECNGVLQHPKALPCSHVVCKKCIDQLLAFKDDGSAIIVCPERECCGSFVLKSEETSDSFPNSKHVMEMVETLMNSDISKENNFPRCEEKEKQCTNIIHCFCSSCETKICASCLQDHQCDRNACVPIVFDKHAEEFLPLCEEHQSCGKGICQDCNLNIICVYCENRDHKSHNISSFNEYAAQSKAAYISLLEEFKSQITEVNVSYKDEMEKLLSFKEQLKQELQIRKLEQMNKFYDKLAAEESKILKELDLKIVHFTEKLNRNNLIEKSQGDAINTYIEDIKNKADASVTIERKAILERIDDLSSIHCFKASLPAKMDDTQLLGKLEVKVFKESAVEAAAVLDIKMEKIIDEEERIDELLDALAKHQTEMEETLSKEKTALRNHFEAFTTEDLFQLISDNRISELSLALQYNSNCVTLDLGSGQTMLHLACINGNTSAVEMLLLHGADVNLKDNDGSSPLLLATQFDNMSLVPILIKYQADVNTEDNNKYSPLIYAALNGDLHYLELLLNHHANVNHANVSGLTALMYAALNGDLHYLELLLNHNANVNHADCDGWTALMNAACYGHAECVKLLLEHNAATDLRNGQNQTAFDLARNHKDIQNMITSHMNNK